ncbi:MAP4 protein, partial [Polyodon spathula]|nr:MAP4 protein [Polyodon spathula]
MADLDLSLSDALVDSPPPGVEEPVVQTDFIASLEAEKFDDVVGETVDKTDYHPLLDNDEEPKNKSCVVREKAVLENGEHDGQEAQKTGKRSAVYRTGGLEPENTSDAALDRSSQTFPTHDPPEEGGSVQGPTVTDTVGNML